jgi:hypothetical protein
MKLFTILCTLLFCFEAVGQRFGEFASAIKINNCGTAQFYNTTGAGANCINTTCATVFNGVSFGSFNQNSAGFSITGGEIKSWKAADGNVCSARLNYVVYVTGSRPGSPVFTAMNLPYKTDCNTGISTFNDGLGPCGARDLKWSIESNNVNLTTGVAGSYTLEIYYDYIGSDVNSSDCELTRYINNSNNPTNYTATFTIVASGATCGLLPVELLDFTADCNQGSSELNWSTASERENAYFIIESSNNGTSWNFESKVSGNGTTSTITYYSEKLNNISLSKYIRLRQVDLNGVQSDLRTITLSCEQEEYDFQIFPNPNNGNFDLIFYANSTESTSDLVIYDTKGSLIYIESHKINLGLNKLSISKKMAEGVYFLNLINPYKTSEFKKMIIR